MKSHTKLLTIPKVQLTCKEQPPLNKDWLASKLPKPNFP